jgi:hypothetical protein
VKVDLGTVGSACPVHRRRATPRGLVDAQSLREAEGAQDVARRFQSAGCNEKIRIDVRTRPLVLAGPLFESGPFEKNRINAAVPERPDDLGGDAVDGQCSCRGEPTSIRQAVLARQPR